VQRFAVLACALLLAALLAACTYMDTTWQGTKRFYREYVNVDPAVELELSGHEPWEERMAALFAPVDSRIDFLARTLDARDQLPSEEWTEALFSGSPWISGLAAVSLAGEVLDQQPEVPMKPLSYEPLTAIGDGWKDRRLRSVVEETPLGPEVLLGTPFFDGKDLAGVIVAHFDVRSVIASSPSPEDLVLFTPGVMLWEGPAGPAAVEVLALPWAEILADEVQGSFTAGGREYNWLARYLGGTPFIYAVVDPEE
jgi:hypothetical protein